MGFKLLGIDLNVEGYAVCDNNAYFQRKVSEDIQQWAEQYAVPVDVNGLSIVTHDQYIGPDYGQAGPEIFAWIKKLAALEGVILDPVYTGKAFYGMVKDIRQGRYSNASDIVFLHTGGIFGLFAQQQKLDY